MFIFSQPDQLIEKINPKLKYKGIYPNIVLAILEIVGFVYAVNKRGVDAFRFYTIDSNLLSFFMSTIYSVVVFLSYKKKKDLPKFLTVIKLISSSCLFLTFIVVIFVLAPTSEDVGETYIKMLFYDSSLYYHFLCPLISIASFIIFDSNIKLNWKNSIICLIVTLIYGITVLILDICKVIEGPYIFLQTEKHPWYAILFMLIGVVAGNCFLVLILIFAANKVLEKRKFVEIIDVGCSGVEMLDG